MREREKGTKLVGAVVEHEEETESGEGNESGHHTVSPNIGGMDDEAVNNEKAVV